MKVLIVNTTENKGGAAVAARRLALALKGAGVYITMLVRDKYTKSTFVVPLKESFWNIIRFAWERICILLANGIDKKNLFTVSIANTGVDITRLPEFAEADIIHLHWVNQGMISLNGLKKIFDSGKPVVWTMHDMWPGTGICHHARDCENYTRQCGNCQFIKEKSLARDLSYITYRKKEKIYKSADNITFVTCSDWLRNRTIKSSLIGNKNIITIPNPIFTNVFCRKNKNENRKLLGLPEDKKLILFGSVKITDKRKGIDYLVEACNILADKLSERKKDIGVVVIGQNSEQIENVLPFEIYTIPYISEEMKLVSIYNSVDVFATPSLEENLPNMIMEAMACGIPCVGFNIGGIPEMIDHLHNGYVAEYKSARDFAKGLSYVLFDNNYSNMSEAAIRKVQECYSEKIVAERYLQVYNTLISRNSK